MRPFSVIAGEKVPGNQGKSITEYFNSRNGTESLSMALMEAPPNWVEVGSTPKFKEYLVVLEGEVRILWKDGEVVVESVFGPGMAVKTEENHWISFGAGPQGAKYFSVCEPSWTPDSVNYDQQVSLPARREN